MTSDQARAATALGAPDVPQMQRLLGGVGRIQEMLYRYLFAASFGASGGLTDAGASAEAGLGSGSAAEIESVLRERLQCTGNSNAEGIALFVSSFRWTTKSRSP